MAEKNNKELKDTEMVEETVVTSKDTEETSKETNEKVVNNKVKVKKDKAGVEGPARVFMNTLSLAIVGLIAIVVIMVLMTGNNKAISVTRTIDSMLNKNPYIQLIVGENQYMYLLYNKNGEAIVEGDTGGSAFYRKDGKLISIGSDKANIMEDIDPIRFIKNAIEIADKESGCSITSEKQTNEVEGEEIKTTEYVITINGKANIKKIYAKDCSDEYSEQALETMFTGHESAVDTVLRIGINVGKSGELGVISNISFKDKAQATDDKNNADSSNKGNTESTEEYNYTMWMFDGYLETFDWELSEEWYNTKEEDVDTWLKLADNIMLEIKEKMSKLIEDYGDAENNVGLIDYTAFIEMEETAKLDAVSSLCETLTNAGYKITCDNVQLLEGINKKYSDENYKSWLLIEVVEEVLAENSWIQYSDGTPIEVTQ